jgi:hypothetical protein
MYYTLAYSDLFHPSKEKPWTREEPLSANFANCANFKKEHNKNYSFFVSKYCSFQISGTPALAGGAKVREIRG